MRSKLEKSSKKSNSPKLKPENGSKKSVGWKAYLENCSKIIGFLRSIVFDVMLLAILTLLIILVTKELKRKTVTIEDFNVLKELENENMGNRLFTNKLLDKLYNNNADGEINMEYDFDFNEVDEYDFDFVKAADPTLDIQVPSTGITFKSLIQFLNRFWGEETTLISGDISLSEGKHNTTIRINGKPFSISSNLSDSDTLNITLDQCYLYIKIYTQPLKYMQLFYVIGDSIYKDIAKYMIVNNRTGKKIAHFILGLRYDAQNNYTAAIKEYQEAITIDPTYVDPFINWGVLLSKQEKYGEAISKYQEAIKIYEKISPINTIYRKAYSNWGEALSKQGKYEEAIDKFKEITEFYPLDSNAYNYWGKELLNQKKYKEAKDKFYEQIVIDPTSFDAHNNLGQSLENLGEYDEAKKEYGKAIAIDSSSFDAHENLGQLLELLKEYREAITEYARALELVTNDSIKNQLVIKIDELQNK